MTRTTHVVTIVPSVKPERPVRIAGYSAESLVNEYGQPAGTTGSVTLHLALDSYGTVVDRGREFTPRQARDVAFALLRAAKKADER